MHLLEEFEKKNLGNQSLFGLLYIYIYIYDFVCILKKLKRLVHKL